MDVTPMEITASDANESAQIEKQELEEAKTDEDSTCVVEDYNILSRPAIAVHKVNNKVEDMTAGLPGQGVDLPYSDSDSPAEDSGSDSDSDCEPKLKRRMGSVPTFEAPKEVSMITGAIAMPEVVAKMYNFQKNRKRNNVWAQVLTDELQEEAVEQLGFVNVDSRPARIERGPESYAFKRGRNAPWRKRKGNPFERGYKGPDGDSDVSETGLSDDDLEYLRTNEATIHADAKAEQISEGAFTETGKLSVADVKAALFKVGIGKKLGNFMAKELMEPKKDMIVRAVELLGRSYCVRMFVKTLKIERKGGLLVKDRSRRRSPGGVFLHMIRKDPKHSEELKAKLFGPKEEKQSRKKQVKA